MIISNKLNKSAEKGMTSSVHNRYMKWLKIIEVPSFIPKVPWLVLEARYKLCGIDFIYQEMHNVWLRDI